MRSALLIAWREIRWEIFGDRGSIVRMGFFAILPVIFVLMGRSPRGPNDLSLVVLGLESVLIPALSGVALISSTFTQEKENGTIVPLLAAPIADMDIVVGKLLGMILPVLGVCIGSLAVYYFLASTQYGVARVAEVLTPELLYALVVLALLYLLTAGSWVLIVAAMVRSTRAGQQIAGLLIGVSVAVFFGAGAAASQIGNGWPLLALGAGLVLSDVVALQIARRVWRRDEVLARL